MLLATPKELINKISYESSTLHPICTLTESEQIVYDKFLAEFNQALRERFDLSSMNNIPSSLVSPRY